MSSEREREREREVRWNIFTWRNWLDNQYVPNNSNINNNNRSSSSSTKESRNRSGVCKWTRVPSHLRFIFGVVGSLFSPDRTKEKRKKKRNKKEREREGKL
jgi:hypothetical protein